MAPEISLFLLAGIVLALLLLLVLVGSFRMPSSHSQQQLRRAELRKALLRNKMEAIADDAEPDPDGKLPLS